MLTLIGCFIHVFGIQSAQHSLPEVKELTCEYLASPVGVEAARPRLGWILTTGRQTAYQIIIERQWNSGKVISDRSINIPYGGKPLKPETKYRWKVRVWNEEGKPSAWSEPATFSTGVREWKAKWIGATQGDATSRLGIAVESDRAEVSKWVQIDLGQTHKIDSVILHPQTHFDPQAGGLIKGYAFPLRFRVDVSDDPTFTTYKTIDDRTRADFPNPGQSAVVIRTTNTRARYVRLTVSKLWHRGQNLPYAYTLAQIEVLSGKLNIARQRTVTASDSVEAYGWGKDHLTSGIVQPPQEPELIDHPHAAIYLRKEMDIQKPIKRATAYMCGLGWSELSVNGQKVGDAVLSPEFTDYNKRVTYVVLDVTRHLKQGKNALGEVLGNGFSSTPGMGYLNWYGNGGAPRLLLQIAIEYNDGSRKTLISDGSWKWSTGEITFNDLWQGETIDHRLAQSGWNQTSFSDQGWHPAKLVEKPKGRLVARTIPPIRVLETSQPISIEGNRFTFKNTGSGWLRLKVKGQRGDKIVVRYRYGLPQAGWSPKGWMVGTECILNGKGEEIFEPKFLFHTIDPTVTVDGLRQPPTKATVTRCSPQIDLRRVGSFACSNAFLNRQYEALLQTQRNYNGDYPLDPTREKSGWTQDVMTMIHSTVYDFDAADFYWNWWQDMRDNQRKDGYLGSVVPLVDRVLDDCNCVWWSGMIVYTPWYLYQYYGDTRFIEESYPAMDAYMKWLATKADSDKIVSWGLGDWLEVGAESAPVRTDVAITSTCGYYLYATILHRSALLLGKTQDAKRYSKLAEQIQQGFNARFVNPQTGQVGANTDSQTAQILPLQLGIIQPEQRDLVLNRLIANIHERKDHLSTGFIGTSSLLLGLPDQGQAELTHKIVMQQDFPGWNTLVMNGVQMETWAGGQVQMPSLGGPIGAYLYQVLAGIRPGAPGFKKVIIKPAIVGDLTWVKAHLDCPYGRIVSSWKRDGNQVTLDVTIPANTTAIISVPGKNGGTHEVGPGRHQFKSLL